MAIFGKFVLKHYCGEKQRLSRNDQSAIGMTEIRTLVICLFISHGTAHVANVNTESICRLPKILRELETAEI